MPVLMCSQLYDNQLNAMQVIATCDRNADWLSKEIYLSLNKNGQVNAKCMSEFLLWFVLIKDFLKIDPDKIRSGDK